MHVLHVNFICKKYISKLLNLHIYKKSITCISNYLSNKKKQNTELALNYIHLTKINTKE